MRKTFLLIAGTAALLVPCVAHAQGGAAPSDKEKFEALTASHKIALTAPEPDAGTGVQNQRFALTTSTDDNVLGVSLALVKPAYDGMNDQALNLSFKAPLGALGGDNGSSVADLGLADKFSGSISYSLIRTDFGASMDEATANERLHRGCATLSAAAKADTEVKQFCDNDIGVREMEREDLLLIANGDPRLIQAADSLTNYNRRKNSQPLLLVNLTGSVGVRDYASVNPADFSERKVERASFAMSATAGVSFGNTGLFAGAGYQYRRDYSDPEKRSVCPPGVTTDCPVKIFDLPTPDIDHSAFALVRFQGPQVGLAAGTAPVVEVRVAYDFEDKLWGVQIPIYFVADEKGGLRGGLRFTYESRGNDPNKQTTSFGVFMVKSFDRLGLGF